MHGYDLWRELLRCEVGDWAGISRAHVYYSLRKALRLGWLRERREEGRPPTRRPRRVLAPTPLGLRAMAASLADPGWAVRRPPGPFHTWMALSPHASPAARRAVIARRRAFLEAEVRREKDTLVAIAGDPGPLQAIAAWMVGLTVAQFELELAWLGRLPAPR
jgi:DNA-binding PadR family transcriptional regulator